MTKTKVLMKDLAHLAFYPSWHLRLNKFSIISNYTFTGINLHTQLNFHIYMPMINYRVYLRCTPKYTNHSYQ